jgi:hypothetical protein
MRALPPLQQALAHSPHFRDVIIFWVAWALQGCIAAKNKDLAAKYKRRTSTKPTDTVEAMAGAKCSAP